MQRDKGRKAEAEVAAIYRFWGFAVRGLEGSGDHLAVGHGLVIHSEVKRQETLRLPLWSRQALAEAPMGAIPVVAFRRNREPWSAIVPEGFVIEQLREAGLVAGIHYSLTAAAGGWWARLLLQDLLGALRNAAESPAAQEAL